jgi:hypothetical protein
LYGSYRKRPHLLGCLADAVGLELVQDLSWRILTVDTIILAADLTVFFALVVSWLVMPHTSSAAVDSGVSAHGLVEA